MGKGPLLMTRIMLVSSSVGGEVKLLGSSVVTTPVSPKAGALSTFLSGHFQGREIVGGGFRPADQAKLSRRLQQ